MKNMNKLWKNIHIKKNSKIIRKIKKNLTIILIEKKKK